MAEGIRLLIVDDRPRARQSLKALLTTWPHIRVIWEASDGAEALRVIPEARPDVILMDARMPGVDGLEATRKIKSRWPDVRLILMSMFGDYSEQATAAGADAFISKLDPEAQVRVILSEIAACERDRERV